MILRLFRARVLPGHEVDLAEFIRDHAITGALRTEGLRSFQPGIRRDAEGSELVLLSTWRDFNAILDVSTALDSPLSAPDAADFLSPGRSEHFELVWGDSRTLPLRGGILRITRVPIEQRYESAYFSELRDAAERLLDRAGLTALSVGRQSTPGSLEVFVVTVWEDQAALEAAIEAVGDQKMLFAPLARYHAGPIQPEIFEALTAVVPRPDAPAILVVDDEGRYIHATPAAERLTGRSLARLLTLGVEDLAPNDVRPEVPAMWRRFVEAGVQSGSFTIARPDGTESRVAFQARSGTPWPGTHSSLLVPEDDPTDLDIDTALARSGLVARYSLSR